jgi:hypothetical protein
VKDKLKRVMCDLRNSTGRSLFCSRRLGRSTSSYSSPSSRSCPLPSSICWLAPTKKSKNDTSPARDAGLLGWTPNTLYPSVSAPSNGSYGSSCWPPPPPSSDVAFPMAGSLLPLQLVALLPLSQKRRQEEARKEAKSRHKQSRERETHTHTEGKIRKNASRQRGPRPRGACGSAPTCFLCSKGNLRFSAFPAVSWPLAPPHRHAVHPRSIFFFRRRSGLFAATTVMNPKTLDRRKESGITLSNDRHPQFLVESPPVLANGGVENGARGGRGPRSAQRTCRE